MACNQRKLARAMQRMMDELNAHLFNPEAVPTANESLDEAIREAKVLLDEASTSSSVRRKDRLVRNTATPEGEVSDGIQETEIYEAPSFHEAADAMAGGSDPGLQRPDPERGLRGAQLVSGAAVHPGGEPVSRGLRRPGRIGK